MRYRFWRKQSGAAAGKTNNYQLQTFNEVPTSNHQHSSTQLQSCFSRLNCHNLIRRKFWVTDILAWAVCAALLIATAIILHQHDGRLVQPLGGGISLNALVSTLISVLYVFLMVPIGSSIAQLKWNHFDAPYPLYDIHLFDEASKGVFGSLALLLTRPIHLLPLLGALLQILIQSIGPFVQQIITTEFQSVPSLTGASLPVAYVLPFNAQYSGSTPFSVDVSMALDFPSTAAVYNGLFTTIANRFDVSSSCQHANCTWPLYNSLAICSECVDITRHIRQLPTTLNSPSNSTFNTYSLPSIPVKVVSITTQDGSTSNRVFDMSATGTSFAFPNDKSLVVSLKLLLLPEPANNTNALLPKPTSFAPPVATECVLRTCARTYNASLVNSNFTETLVGQSTALNAWGNESAASMAQRHSPLTFLPALPWDLAMSNITAPYTNRTLNVSAYAGWGFATFLLHYLNGTVGTHRYVSPQYSGIPIGQIDSTSDAAKALYQTMSSPTPDFTLDMHFKNVAQSLTHYIRTTSGNTTQGSAYNTSLQFSILWPWIAHPVGVILLTLVLLVFTIFDTRRIKGNVWRANVLASMVHGLDAELKGQLLPQDSVDGMEEAAKNLIVVLGEDKGHPVLREEH